MPCAVLHARRALLRVVLVRCNHIQRLASGEVLEMNLQKLIFNFARAYWASAICLVAVLLIVSPMIVIGLCLLYLFKGVFG